MKISYGTFNELKTKKTAKEVARIIFKYLKERPYYLSEIEKKLNFYQDGSVTIFNALKILSNCIEKKDGGKNRIIYGLKYEFRDKDYEDIKGFLLRTEYKGYKKKWINPLDH